MLSVAKVPGPGSLTAPAVENMHLQWVIQRPSITQQLQVSKLVNN
jgi:hypothetical protein